MDRYNLVSFLGIFLFLGLGWAASLNRRRLNLRCLVWGTGICLCVGAVVFRAPLSHAVLMWVNGAANAILRAASAGQEFVFGDLARENGPVGFVLATQALPMIIFVGALMGLLYYWPIMPAVIRGFAWLFTRLMRLSGAESVSCAANVFAGVESVLVVRPYLLEMTRSELCTILAAGMATTASNTLIVYVGMLQNRFPTIAGHLVSASIIAVPAAIVMAKLLVPEDGNPRTMGKDVKPDYERDSGAMEAIINGAMSGVRLIVGIVALLIAFLGLLAIVNMGLGAVGAGAGGLVGRPVELSLERILGYAFYPLALMMGVPPADAMLAGGILGERLVVTEIPAYLHLAEAINSNAFSHPRSPVILAYALCGFAHIASLAIFVGGAAALVPTRRRDLAAVGARALLAATLACLMTGAVAGTFYHSPQTVLQLAPG